MAEGTPVANIIVIKDLDGITCYPVTTGEAITVKYGPGEVKEEVNLDELLSTLFTQVISNITPAENVTVDIGSSEKKIRFIFCQKITADEVEAGNIKGKTKVQGKAIVADEQVQVNGITLTKNMAGRLYPSAGIEGAVWN